MRNVILIVCAVAIGLGSAAIALADGLADNFDSYVVGTTPAPPWSKTGGASATVSDSVSVSGNNSLHLSDDGGGTQVHLSQSFFSMTHIVLEYCMLTSSSNHEGAFVSIMGDAGDEYTAAFSNGAFTGEAGYIGIHGGGVGWIKPDLLPYEEDTWYSVRRELDITTNTGSFYVEEVGNPSNNASYSIGRSAYFTNVYIDELRLYTSYSQGADCFVDNVVVTPEPATLTLLTLGGLVRRRKCGMCK